MALEISIFGKLKSGMEVKQITLTNGRGTSVSVLDYGVTLRRFVIDGTDILLGYDSITDYENANGSYIGATIGRFCNRIAGGRFTLDGKEIQLACNAGGGTTHIHGGNVGFDKRIWNFEILKNDSDPAVRFFRLSPDGEENYPGNLDVSVTVTLTEDDTLILSYHAKTDADTVVNLTNHSYFNLNGFDGENVMNTILKVNADSVTAADEKLVPTGEYLSVDGTPLDFRKPKPIGEAANSEYKQIKLAGGVDHNYVLRDFEPDPKKRKLREAAVAFSPATGIKLTCSTDLPGIQVYTGNFLCENAGKNGIAWKKRQGFCLETQFFPDCVNHKNFPSAVLKKGDCYSYTTAFHVEKSKL